MSFQLGVNCLNPVTTPVSPSDDKNKKIGLVLPCGHCFLCVARRRREWTLRLIMESKYYSPDEICFTTLTYSDNFVPKTDLVDVSKRLKAYFDGTKLVTDKPLSLFKDDEKNFMKRLRRRLDYKVRFFCVGEYGARTGRPHMHLVIFGLKPKDWYKVVDAWQKGFVCNKNFYNETCGYVAGYIQKKLFEPNAYGVVVPPFARMSNRPALGSDYFLENAHTICAQGFIVNDGFKYPIPRVFVRKAVDMGLLPKTDLEEYQLIQNIKSSDMMEHLESQGMTLSDYERNIRSLAKVKHSKMTASRNLNVEV